MKEYEFIVHFYATYGTFTIKAERDDVAMDTAYQIIENALKDLPVEVDYDLELVNFDDEDGEDAEDDEIF